MASSIEFIEFVCTRLREAGTVHYRKMFGDYMVYLNGKPLVLVCDDIAYVKKHPAIAGWMQDAETGIPYEGAKEHYILDVEHTHPLLEVVTALEKVLPAPRKRKTE